MNEIDLRLEERKKAGNPVQVAIIGAGQMGTEIITQIGMMRGMDVVAVVDLTMDKAMAGFSALPGKVGPRAASTCEEAEKAHADGHPIVSTDYKIAVGLSGVEAVVDATGSTDMGAVLSLECIHNKKHIIMMNVECDVTIGPILRRMADDAGIVYSLAAGDEPAAIIELYRFVHSLGFEIVSAGKGKNNPLDVYAAPADVKQKADERKMSARMLCEFVDGSKTAVEMAAVSNATGLLPDKRGMHGAKSSVETLNQVFVSQADGGVFSCSGVVDFAIGVHPGVFVIFKTDNERIKEGLVQRDMGEGPNYTLYRPYHLCSIEVPLTIAQAVFYGESSGHPGERLVSECLAVTKRDLKADEVLDGIGETCYRGSIDTYEAARKENLLPLGLAKGCKLVTDVPKDTPISYDMVEFKVDSVLRQLRGIQDNLGA